MRIKFLSVIVSFLLVSFAMSSCLGEDDPIEYSPNALVQAFELDKILGTNYQFTIDQLSGKIYNQDSLPVGSDTIIDRILITKLTIAGFVTIKNSAGTEDSIFNIADSINLVGTMEILPDGTPGKPFRFKVWAPDMAYTKEYSLSVRVHQQQPDSLNWGKEPVATNFAPAITGKQKSVIFKNQILTYASSTVYSTSLADGKNWDSNPVSGLPSTLTSIVNFKNMLYATVDGNHKVYSSDNGKNWGEATAFGENTVRLIAPINNILTGIKTFEETDESGANQTVERFCTTADGSNWTKGEIAPQDFPRNNLSVTSFKNIIGVSNIMAVGNIAKPTENDTATVAWAYMEGQEWVPLTVEGSFACPLLEDPSIVYYGDALYIFGRDFKTFYKSESGIVWNEVKEKFMFPQANAAENIQGFRGEASDYSMVADQESNFIWIMRSTPNEVWRGRLNLLGFARQ